MAGGRGTSSRPKQHQRQLDFSSPQAGSPAADNRQNKPRLDSFEESRLERIERLFGNHPAIKTAAKFFDEAAFREATAIAQKMNHQL